MATLDQAIEQMYAAGMPSFPDGVPIADGRVHRYGPKKKAYYKLYEFAARNGKRYISGWYGYNGQFDLTKIQRNYEGIEPDEYKRLQASQAQLEVQERQKREARVRFASMRATQQWDDARARPAEGESHPYLVKKRLQWGKGLRLARDGTLYVPMVRYDVSEEQMADIAYTGPRRLAGLQKISADGGKFFNKGMDPVGAACRFGRKPKDGDLLLLGEGLATVLTAHQGLERAYTCFVAFTAGNLAPVARILRKLYPKSPLLFLADDDAYLEAQLNKRLRDDWGVQQLFRVMDVEQPRQSDRFGEIVVSADLHEDTNGTPVLTAGIQHGDPGSAKLRTLILTNAGRTKAWEAARELGNAWAIWPTFTDRVLGPDPDAPRLTDFNDLHVAEGLGQAVLQLGDEIRRIQDAIELSHAIAAGVAPGGEETSKGSDGGKGNGGDGDGTDWRLHWNMLTRFTLVERSGMSWDVERGALWRIEHMKHSFGTKAVNMWLASRRRRSVDVKQLVFDPRGLQDASKTINLFRGLETKPAAGSCDKLLKLLLYLCGEEEATETPISDWVLKWCACLVQHVGAKMKTAVVMHGPEGAGKNLFWSALLRIFDPYSALIGQAELEDRFNTWQSAKLFIVANEVVTRAEMSHHVGRLKNLVTEDKVSINPKFQEQRYEDNHVNIVFLSNEFQPLKISPGDRRYMVIRTPGMLGGAFYAEVAAEFKAGGAAAFMQYLLELDLGDFGEHTKPIATEAKKDLIEIGMMPSQLYWQEIKDGLLPLPYCPALSTDLYAGYTVWCQRNGHKMPEALNRFTPNFMSMNGVRRREPRVPDPDKLDELAVMDVDLLRKRRVFFMGSRTEGVEERQWLVDGIKKFRKALRDYQAESDWRGSGGLAEADRHRQQAF